MQLHFNQKHRRCFSVVQIFRPEYYDCDEQDPISQIQNYPEDFGYEHVCGQVTYNWPDLNGMKESNSNWYIY